MLIGGKSPAARRYKRRSFAFMGGYFAIYLSAFYVAYRFHPAGAQLFALAALPVLPILAVIFLTGSYLREERDELSRDLVVRCLLWG
jgi:hypothetical protein